MHTEQLAHNLVSSSTLVKALEDDYNMEETSFIYHGEPN